jgi:hypothetical protein
MNNTDENHPDSKRQDAAHHRWLTIEALQPGMVLAKPVHIAQHGLLVMKLGEGSELQANTIDQLFSRGVECVPVRIDSTLDEQQLASMKNAHLERLLQIFASASEAEVAPNCHDLFAALLKAGPQI